jgi:transposase
MMNARNLFASALGLNDQWEIADFEISENPSRLVIQVYFKPGEKFACPHCSKACPVHDSQSRQWQRLNFWQYPTFLTARVPRIKCPDHGVKSIQVPWARPGSGFTFMMEHFIMMLVRKMPVDSVAEILKVCDTRLWRVVDHYVTQAHGSEDWSGVREILVDETSMKKGHKYATVVLDAATRKLLWMGKGRESKAVGEFVKALKAHGGNPDQIRLVGIDMSNAYQKGVRKYFPKAVIVFDRFHIMKMAGEAVDKLRKKICEEHADLKRHRWAFLGNETNKSERQLAIRQQYSREYAKLGRAIGLRDALQDVLESRDWDSLL